MQIQTTMTYHLTWSEWPSSKNLQTKNAGGGMEKRGPSYTVGENVNAVLHSTSMENSICCAVLNRFQFSSVQFSCSVVSDSLQPHESQHARPPCPSPSPGVHSNSRPSSWWYHPAISSSVIPFSSCPQPLPASESFPMSQLFTSGG